MRKIVRTEKKLARKKNSPQSCCPETPKVEGLSLSQLLSRGMGGWEQVWAPWMRFRGHGSMTVWPACVYLFWKDPRDRNSARYRVRVFGLAPVSCGPPYVPILHITMHRGWVEGGKGWGGGPVQIACSGAELNDVQPSSSPWWSMRNPINQPFTSQLSKHVSVCHHGCYWFLI